MQLWVFCSLLLFVAVGCLAQRPRPCRSPPLLQGSFSVATQNGGFTTYGKYAYDAFFQRIRLGELVFSENRTIIVDFLLLYRQNVMYRIDNAKKTCQKQKLMSDFHPMKIPCNASFLAQVVLGSLSGPAEGLVVNVWNGETLNDKAQYMLTFTEFGCLPISAIVNRPKTGWITTSFFNIVRGITDPALFIPPPFCQNASMEAQEGDFFSAFF